MARLPQPGGDSGNWGTILNEYLSQAHKADGTLKDDSVNATQITDQTIVEAKLAPPVQAKLNQAAPSWSTISGKPVIVAAGSDAAEARSLIGAASKPRSVEQAAGVGEIIINADDYGVARDGITDDTAALTAAFAAAEAAARSTSVLGGTAVLQLRAGRYIDSASRVFTKRIVIRGEGKLNTILYRKNGSTGDYLTFNNQYSSIEGVTVDGNRMNNPDSGDLIVLNAYQTAVVNAHVRNAKGNGITVGKAAAALGHTLSNVSIGQCSGYGVYVSGDFGSTDGIWSDIGIGQCGLSGARLSTGAQNLSLVHSWGNGLESASDNHGILIDSVGNVLLGYQGETNLGYGISIQGSANHGNSLLGGKIWGNGKAGICVDSAIKGIITGTEVYRNACLNTTSVLTEDFAGIVMSGTEWSLSGLNVWDDSGSVPAGVYTSNSGNPGNFGYTPTYPFPGRAAGVRYQSYNYAELSGADHNIFSGCVMKKENTLSQVAFLVIALFNRMSASANSYGGNVIPSRSIVSGVIRCPPESDTVYVSSTSTLSSMTGGYAGRRCTLIFTALTPGQVVHATSANGLDLSGSVAWTPARWSSLTLVYDGSRWFETSRKAS